jgi:diacylglycerol O-acyltransferase / wax synthase
MTFGINADFDAFPDIDVLSGGIRTGIEELMHKAEAVQRTATDTATGPTAPAKRTPAKTPPRKEAAKKATTAAAR